MGPGYVLKLLSRLKITEVMETQQPQKLGKNKRRFGIVRILEFL
jgi:hypothetical protein